MAQVILPREVNKRGKVVREALSLEPTEETLKHCGQKRRLEESLASGKYHGQQRKNLKKKQKKQRNIPEMVMTVPYTKTQQTQALAANANQPLQLITKDQIVKDHNGDICVKYIKRGFTPPVLQEVTRETAELCNHLFGPPVPLSVARPEDALQATGEEDYQGHIFYEEGESSTRISERRHIPSPVHSPDLPQESDRPPRQVLTIGPPPPLEPPSPPVPVPQKKKCPSRGQDRVSHFGVTRRNTKHTVLFKTTKDPKVLAWVSKAQSYLQELRDTAREDFFYMTHHLGGAPPTNKGEYTNFAGWPAFALVEGISKKMHVDSTDCRNTMCCITTLGDYEGGELEFPTLGLKFAMRPGDIIIFKSHLLHHNTSALLLGRRFSLVFFAHHNLYTTKVN